MKLYEIYKSHNEIIEKVCEFKEIKEAIKYCREHNPNDDLYFTKNDTWYYIRPKEEKNDTIKYF